MALVPALSVAKRCRPKRDRTTMRVPRRGHVVAYPRCCWRRTYRRRKIGPGGLPPGAMVSDERCI